VLAGTSGALALRTAMFPKCHGVAGIVIAVALFVGAARMISTDAAIEDIFGVATAAFIVWLVLAGIFMYRGTERALS